MTKKHKVTGASCVKYLLGTSLLALNMGGIAIAQDNDSAPREIEAIVVTAQKREQNQQDVPITLNAFGTDFMEQVGAENMKDLQLYTPGLEISGLTQPRFTIRGVNTSDFGVGTDPAVGVYIDGVYAARSGAALIFFNDVERVEVLKGPQGTLFGRNTAAGAVSIINKKPAFETEANAALRLGKFGKIRFEGMVNVPVTDTFALRMNYMDNSQNGWLTDAVSGKKLGDENNAAYRVSGLWKPTEDLEMILSYDRDRTRNDGPIAIGIGVGNLNGGDPFGDFANDVVNPGEDRNLDGLTFTLNYDLNEDFTLTNISAFKKFKTRNKEDEDGTANIATYFDTENYEENKHFYEELRINGTLENFTITAGVSYYWEDAHQESRTNTFTDTIDTVLTNIGAFPFPPFAATTQLLNQAGYDFNLLGLAWNETMYNEGKYSAYAAFGDITWSATDKLNVTVGLRYTEDKKEFSWLNGPRVAPEVDYIQSLIGVNDFNFDFIFPVGALEGQSLTLNKTWDDVSGRVVVDYKVADHIMAYGSYAQGYKAGGFNSVEINSQFEPESVENYEIGIKSEWFERSLRLNASAYEYHYDDKQEISLESLNNAGVPQYVTRTGDTKGTGFDVELTWLPADMISIFANYGYLDAEWSRRIQNGIDISGQPTGTPSKRLAVGADFFFNTDDGAEIRYHVDYSYTSANRRNDACVATGSCTNNLYNFETGVARNITNARITWTHADGFLSASAFVKNLFDKQYVGGVNNITTATLGTPYARISQPMTWGIDLRVNF